MLITATVMKHSTYVWCDPLVWQISNYSTSHPTSVHERISLYKTLLKHYIHQLLFDNLTKNNNRPAITLFVSTYFEEHHFHKNTECTRTLKTKKNLRIFRKHKNNHPPFDQIRNIGISTTWIYIIQSFLSNHNTRTAPLNKPRHQQTPSTSERHNTQPRKLNDPYQHDHHHRLTHHGSIC